MDTRKYGLRWEKDESLPYSIYPRTRLRIIKPKRRIKLDIPFSRFSSDKPLMWGDETKIQYDGFDEDEGITTIYLSENTKVRMTEDIYYGLQKVKWKSLSAGFSGKINQVSDRLNTEFDVKVHSEGADYVILECSRRIDGDIFIEGVKVEFRDITPRDLRGVKLRDRNGPLSFKATNSRSIVEVVRPIEGALYDQDRFQYNWNERQSRRKGDRVWIQLKEPEDDFSSADDEEGSKIELFFELLQVSFDFEVWENPFVKPKEKKGRIKIYRVESEENRILLDHEPKSEIIYPPKNTHQLKMQKNAVETLIRRPSPDHRNLLKLFEPYDVVNWESSSNVDDENDIEWLFLTDIKRKGTDEQRQFVMSALSTRDFNLLEGPPGSGKTTAISELVYQLLIKKKRVLLSASTHVAVDNVIEKLVDRFRADGGLLSQGITPLRIGRELGKISEDIRPFQSDKRFDEMKKKVIKSDLIKNLEEKEQDRAIDELVVNSSNLVCGTTFGILQYPKFKDARWDFVTPEFDYLIIDEASKTTFQEFLVPAIYAKRWILVGDIHQLSPFTDTLHVRVNLEGTLKRSKEIAQLVYLKLIYEGVSRNTKQKGRPPDPQFVYVDSKYVIRDLLLLVTAKIKEDKSKNYHSRFLEFCSFAFVLDSFEGIPDTVRYDIEEMNNVELMNFKTFQREKFKLLGISIIFAESSVYRGLRDNFTSTHLLIRPGDDYPDPLLFRHQHWTERQDYQRDYDYRLPRGKYTSDPNLIREDIMGSLSKNWAGELAWRIKRVYELQGASEKTIRGNSAKYYESSMHALLPPDNTQHYKIWSKIKKISHIYLPSVLQSMQEGVSQFARKDDVKTVLSHGFPTGVLRERHQKLSYQQRMHPHISEIPRELYYRNEALHDVPVILEGGRDWSYSRYEHRVTWMDVPDGTTYRNTNRREANIIMKEIRKFTRWAKQNPKDDGSNYDIIILSFYEKQRGFIRDILQQTEINNQNKQTRFTVDGINVYNYTVDKVQGREGDVVFLSMTQTHRVGFMDSPNRQNVAITRARYQLVIVGKRDFYHSQNNSFELHQIAKLAHPPYEPPSLDDSHRRRKKPQRNRHQTNRRRQRY